MDKSITLGNRQFVEQRTGKEGFADFLSVACTSGDNSVALEDWHGEGRGGHGDEGDELHSV